MSMAVAKLPPTSSRSLNIIIDSVYYICGNNVAARCRVNDFKRLGNRELSRTKAPEGVGGRVGHPQSWTKNSSLISGLSGWVWTSIPIFLAHGRQINSAKGV